MIKKHLINLLNHLPYMKRAVKKAYQYVGTLFSNRRTQPKWIQLESSSKTEHLFGYYDKCPWSPDAKNMLYLSVMAANKRPSSTSQADIILKDTASNTERVIACTNTWNVQQGCMLQWLNSNNEFIYNDFREQAYVAIIHNLKSNTQRTVCRPVYSVSADGKSAISLDFVRLNTFRPGYGYVNTPDKTAQLQCPDEPCLWFVNLTDDTAQTILKYTDLLKIYPKDSMLGAYHKVNHVMINPNGTRFMFLHRWMKDGKKYDRLLTCNMDGTEIYDLLDEGMVSHSFWLSDSKIITYASTYRDGSQYYVLVDKTQEKTVALGGKLHEDGHPSLSPDGKYIITDTYPNFMRKQTLFLCHIESGSVKKIAEVYANPKYSEECRCDLHPRWNRSSDEICFDGAPGRYRQVYSLALRSDMSKDT